MKTNPFLDSLKYIFALISWSTIAFDVMLLAGIVVAVVAYRRYPAQRTGYHIWTWFARTVLGAMWWQQVIWKLPPSYGGLRFWMQEMAKYASVSLQHYFVANVVLTHFSFFAPQVFLAEVLICVTLLLGVWTRFGSLLGAAMSINLMLGLYRSPSEWPWTYVFLVVIMIQFFVVPPGRSLGVDVFLAQGDASSHSPLARLLRWAR